MVRYTGNLARIVVDPRRSAFNLDQRADLRHGPGRARSARIEMSHQPLVNCRCSYPVVLLRLANESVPATPVSPPPSGTGLSELSPRRS
jgi:hypothetical protein